MRTLEVRSTVLKMVDLVDRSVISKTYTQWRFGALEKGCFDF